MVLGFLQVGLGQLQEGDGLAAAGVAEDEHGAQQLAENGGDFCPGGQGALRPARPFEGHGPGPLDRAGFFGQTKLQPGGLVEVVVQDAANPDGPDFLKEVLADALVASQLFGGLGVAVEGRQSGLQGAGRSRAGAETGLVEGVRPVAFEGS